jgi:RNA polymerase sigma factor (sigma-70 family)
MARSRSGVFGDRSRQPGHSRPPASNLPMIPPPPLTPPPSPPPSPSQPADPVDESSRLALAWRAGDRSALTPLYGLLRPLILAAFKRYRGRPGDQQRALPTTLESDDLAQESWLILAELLERWRPEGGNFGAYFRVSFPWALAHYIRLHSPSRRARGVQVLGANLPDVQEQIEGQSGVDGREWDQELAWSELLEPLPEREQTVLLLHLAEQQSFTAVAQAMQLTRPAAYRLYRRALKRVQGSKVRVGERTIFLDPASLHPTRGDVSGFEREGDLTLLVQALHLGAPPKGRLPGRGWLARQTGLSEHRVTRLLNLLVQAGCIRARGPRRAGFLVHASAEETLATLGIRPFAQAGAQ